MSVTGLRSKTAKTEPHSDPLAGVRARGLIELTADVCNGVTRRARVREEGALRIRFPNERFDRLDAVIVNVAGGMTGGDEFAIALNAGPDARLAASTVAAEKIYRSSGDPTLIDVSLRLDAGARLIWIPQETIIFANARLKRRIRADLAADASLTMCETTLLGRTAMGEIMDDIGWREQWRIRRDGQLIFADAVRIDGDAVHLLSRLATGNNARAFATLLHVAPDAEAQCERVREALDQGERACEAAATAFDGMLIVRLVAQHGHDLRATLMDCLAALPDAGLPRSWST
ncbi:urease accessory protein UreD [Roseiarcaceae bacterium H3SJ34-1]|uniref:urease accessory protein UreD n=1 Tax=Terripilifer ovatus TaxID=3032367 RepID=UPI003AB997FE|nr:urease accessory protein UreD [Roseiarcaceae bacterium H3SJ34-1]